MVVIRLSRSGAKKRPFYNIVAADKREARDGRFIERLGFYNPGAVEGEEGLRIARDRLDYWLGQGAKASSTVQRLARQAARMPAPVALEPEAAAPAQAEAAVELEGADAGGAATAAA